jgi:hypothetical protein
MAQFGSNFSHKLSTKTCSQKAVDEFLDFAVNQVILECLTESLSLSDFLNLDIASVRQQDTRICDMSDIISL